MENDSTKGTVIKGPWKQQSKKKVKVPKDPMQTQLQEDLIFAEELTEHLKKKFPEQYKLSLEDLINDGSDDPEMEMTPGRFVDHIGDKGEELLKEYEAILKKLNE